MHLVAPAELFGEQGIIVLIVVALVLFGSTQIPKLARSLGSAQKEFKKGLDHGASDADRDEKAVAELTHPTSVTVPAQATAIVETTAAGSSDARPS
jgi:sec-independent protein translocase protein TatA